MRWCILLDRGPLSRRQQQAFERWLRRSPQHELAFRRANAALRILDPAPTYCDAAALHIDHRTTNIARGSGLGRKTVMAVAASAVVAVAPLLLALSLFRPNQIIVPATPAPRTSAPVSVDENWKVSASKGRAKMLLLADGSKLTLVTDSEAEIRFSAHERLVNLSRGQALFEVAKDTSRPFVVEAGGRKVIAVGTMFQVRIAPDQLRVMLVHGRVRIDRDDDIGAAKIPAPRFLAPGEELAVSAGTERLRHVDVDQQLRWRDGYVEFDRTDLITAIREINRFSPTPIILRDPALGKLNVSGTFRNDDPERFASLIAEILPIRYRASMRSVELLAAAPVGASHP